MTQGLSATPKLSLRTFAPYLELLFAAFSPPQKSWIHLGIPSFSKTYVMFFLHNNFQYSGVFCFLYCCYNTICGSILGTHDRESTTTSHTIPHEGRFSRSGSRRCGHSKSSTPFTPFTRLLALDLWGRTWSASFSGKRFHVFFFITQHGH